MTDHDVHLLAATYALDAIDAHERAAFEEHLVHCEACRQEVDEFRAIHATLAQSQAVAPPPALKAKVLADINRVRQASPLGDRQGDRPASAARPRRGGSRVWAMALAAAAAVAVVVVGVSVWSSADPADPFADELAVVLEQPDAEMLELAEQPGGAGRFKVAWSDSLQRAVLIGDDLPPAPDGKAYELWLITTDQSMAMHILDPGSDGTVHVSLDMPQEPSKWAITVEPSAGSEVATGDIIFVGSVGESQ